MVFNYLVPITVNIIVIKYTQKYEFFVTKYTIFFLLFVIKYSIE